MTRFVHLTDLHLSDPAIPDPYLYADTAARLARAAAMIARIDPAPDFVAITGDLTNRGDPASYALLARALDDFDLPLILSLGNHDDRAAFRAQFRPDDAEPDAPYFHHTKAGDLHVIALDSLVPGRIGGAIGAAQFDLLEQALSSHTDCRKLILCHHPPHSGKADLREWESLIPEDSRTLAEILAGHEVAGILSGHVHADRVLNWHGIPVVVSTGLHNTLNSLESADTVIEDAAGFVMCTHLPAGLDVTFVPLAPQRAELGRIGRDAVLSFN